MFPKVLKPTEYIGKTEIEEMVKNSQFDIVGQIIETLD